MADKIQHWLDLAEYDFETAKAMLQTSRFLYVGFMCHQAVEKALKAAAYKETGEAPPKIHNLIRLSELSGLRDGFSEKQKGFLRQLNPMNIEARYTENKNRILQLLSHEVCAEMIAETEELLCLIKARL